jgi:SAM-dependent methyltransferase
VGLYNLVKLKQTLANTVDVSPAIANLKDLQNKLQGILIEIPEIRPEHHEYVNTMVSKFESFIGSLNDSLTDYHAHNAIIDQQITDLTRQLFTNNYELEERYGNVYRIRAGRRLDMTPELEEIVKQKIFVYTSWRYPTLEIGCRDGEWTKFLVAADPLYIMDRHVEFLDSANSQFPLEYQARLRKYHLKQDNRLTALPLDQFAFVFSWGYFNYVSLDTMHQVLEEIMKILRPGGVFMFSYNDGDTPAGAGMAENFSQTYLPKSLLIPLCCSLGFEIIAEPSHGTNIHWLEIKKPGTLSTIKMNQVLGQITARENIFKDENH